MANDYQWNPESMATQKAQIRAHLLRGESITPMDALRLYGAFRLSAIIFDLRAENLPIQMERIQVAPKKRCARYFIATEDLTPDGVQTKAKI